MEEDLVENLNSVNKPDLMSTSAFKIIFILVLIWMSIILIFAKEMTWVWIDYINFLVHESGHPTFNMILNFIPFFDSSTKEFLVASGGTVFQLLIPILILYYFFRKKSWYATCFCLWWIGDNLMNINFYIADARCQCLTLFSIGGGEPKHDWNYMLGRFDLLSSDLLIAKIVYIIGAILMITAIASMFAEVFYHSKINTITKY